MQITRKVEFGLLAMGHFAKYGKDDYVPVITIAKKYDVTAEQVSKAVKRIVRAGLLRNKMGPKGGFKLTKPAKEISMLDIIEIIDGPMEQLLVTSKNVNNEPFVTNMETTRKDIVAKAKDKLQKTTLAMMIKE
jgi:Rrf2 family protein